MSLFSRRPASHAEHVARVKAWVRELLTLAPDTAILVTELQCTEPGCPPLETVIAVLEEGEPPRQYKVHRALTDVSRGDVTAVIAPRTPPASHR